ncbi:MAG: hypothetical protein Q4G67_05345 [Actinomycetia bacterium]|nr:hypothetical protein [Actinomycetes bacterium]
MESRPPRSRWARIGRALLIVALALTLIAVGGHLIKRVTAASSARGDVSEGLPSARTSLEEKSERLTDLVAPALGPPLQSATHLACDFSTRDSGWFANTYVQSCWLSTRAVYEVGEATSRELGDALDALDTDGWLGHPEWGVRSPDTCRLVKYSSGLPSGADHIQVRHFPAGADPQARGCGLANPTTDFSDEDTHLDLDAIDRSRGWVLSTLNEPVSSTRLGCSFPKILFCTNPLSGVQVP